MTVAENVEDNHGADEHRTPSRWTDPLFPLAFWAIGMQMVFGPILWSGLRLTFAGLGDFRLVNFLLEHGYRWVAGYPLHADFWSPPVFYPLRNVAAYTEVAVGAAPPYWALRAVGLEPDLAYLWWIFTVWTLNFFVALLVLRRVFRLATFPASMGAYLFAFGNPRIADIDHQQLAPGFYLLLALTALLVVFESEASARRRRAWIVVFFAALVMQAYAAVYPFYLFGMAVGLAAIWALVRRDLRGRFLDVLRSEWPAVASAAFLALAALLPLVLHYAQAAAEVGSRRYVEAGVPRLASWVLMGQQHPWYGWLQGRDGPYHQLRHTYHSNGVGLFTTALGLLGLAWMWKRKSVQLMVLALATLIIAVTMFPGDFSGWRLIREILPGAHAIRYVSRAGMLTLFPLALGVASFFGRATKSHWNVLLVPLALVVIAEQWSPMRSLDRMAVHEHISSLAAKLDPDCDAFLLISRGEGEPYTWVHDDALWVGIAAGIPTINGRYGNRPTGFGLRSVHVTGAREERRIRTALDRWIGRMGLAQSRVCVIETSDPSWERATEY